MNADGIDAVEISRVDENEPDGEIFRQVIQVGDWVLCARDVNGYNRNADPVTVEVLGFNGPHVRPHSVYVRDVEKHVRFYIGIYHLYVDPVINMRQAREWRHNGGRVVAAR